MKLIHRSQADHRRTLTLVGTDSTPSPIPRAEMGKRWNASLPGWSRRIAGRGAQALWSPTALVVLLALATPSVAAEDDWVSLFNGKNLDGWEQKNGTAKFEAKDGIIIGSSVSNSPNSFLCTKKSYGDFELEFEVMVDRELNSGVQIRSESKPDFKDGRVHGYQVEIAVGGFSGGIYDEARRAKFLNTEKPTDEIRKLVKENEWNRFRIRCQGDHIETWVNDTKVTDLRDDLTKAGFIGLQVHGVGKRTEPLHVRWRNLRLRELKP